MINSGLSTGLPKITYRFWIEPKNNQYLTIYLSVLNYLSVLSVPDGLVEHLGNGKVPSLCHLHVVADP